MALYASVRQSTFNSVRGQLILKFQLVKFLVEATDSSHEYHKITLKDNSTSNSRSTSLAYQYEGPFELNSAR